MKIESLHIGMSVRHPQYGLGSVKSIGPVVAEIEFTDGTHTVAPEPAGLEPAEARASMSGLSMPLKELLEDVAQATVKALGLERPESVDAELGTRWHKGKLVLHPADPTLQTKEVPLETFFHKVVMVRNNLRVWNKSSMRTRSCPMPRRLRCSNTSPAATVHLRRSTCCSRTRKTSFRWTPKEFMRPSFRRQVPKSVSSQGWVILTRSASVSHNLGSATERNPT